MGVKKIFLKRCVARTLCQWRRSTDQLSQRPEKLREATRLVGKGEGEVNGHLQLGNVLDDIHSDVVVTVNHTIEHLL